MSTYKIKTVQNHWSYLLWKSHNRDGVLTAHEGAFRLAVNVYCKFSGLQVKKKCHRDKMESYKMLN